MSYAKFLQREKAWLFEAATRHGLSKRTAAQILGEKPGTLYKWSRNYFGSDVHERNKYFAKEFGLIARRLQRRVRGTARFRAHQKAKGGGR